MLVEGGAVLVQLVEEAGVRRALDVVAGVDEGSRLAELDLLQSLLDQSVERQPGPGHEVEAHHQTEHREDSRTDVWPRTLGHPDARGGFSGAAGRHRRTDPEGN